MEKQSDAHATSITAILDTHRSKPGALLPILHDIQRVCGHVSEAAILATAESLNLTRAEVYGVVSFYHDFHLQPAASRKLRVCEAEACQARGVRHLLDGIDDEQRARIKPVYCLGLCSAGPAAMTEQGTVHARLTQETLFQLIRSLP